ncbi:flagellar export protein FliJ [bacterium]|nr:flagellar export protein FliJ [bacterium]
MKKYSFRLQPVLDLKNKILEDKHIELARVLKILSDYENELKNIEALVDKYNSDFENTYNSKDIVNITAIAGYANYFVDAEQKIKNQKFIIEKTKNVLKMKQNEVNEAYKEVKVLEKLKEVQSQKFYRNIEKKEAEEVDDIMTSRYKFQNV